MSARQFISLFAAVFFLFAGYSLFLNSAGIRLDRMGINAVIIGELNTAFFIGATSSAIMAHRIISRVGHIRSFGVFGACFAMAALAHLMTGNLWLWGILRVMLGFCYFSLLMVVESWFTARSTSQKRAKVLAIYEVTFYAASGTGIALLSLKLPGGNIFALSAILILAAMLPIGLTKLEEPAIPPRQRISLPHVFAIVPLAWTGSFLAGIMVNGFFTMASVFILHEGFHVRQVSIYLGCAMVCGFLSQIPVAHLSNRFGRRRAILCAALFPLSASLLALVSMPVFAGQIYLHYVVAAMAGCGLFTLYSLSLARANDVLPNNMNTVEVNRSLLFVYGLGSLVAPLLMGAMMEHVPHYGFYAIYAVCAGTLALCAWREKPVPATERSVYVSIPGGSGPIIGDLDPRNNAETDVPFDADMVRQQRQNNKS